MPVVPGPGSPLDVSVLGPLEVRRGAELVDIGSPMIRTLLARLLVDVNRVVSLDRLIDDLWDGEPPASATATLQSYISHLRRSLEPERPPRTPPSVLVTRPPGYSLQLAADQLDVSRFVAAVDTGRALLDAGRAGDALERLDTALELWRGEPYGGVDVEVAVLAERRRLAEVHATAVDDRLAALVALGRHRYVLGELEALVAAHPYRERAWELLVLCLYRSGRQVDALRAFQAARSSLVEHAGVEPGPGLVELERRIIQQDPELDWQPPQRTGDNLPAPSPPATASDDAGEHGPPLVGRSHALRTGREILGRAAAGAGGVLLVGGEAGIGKTRLVEELAAPALELGFEVAWGRSTDVEGLPGWWPWTEALGRLTRDLGDDVLLASGSALRHVLPERASCFESSAGADEADLDADALRFAVQRAVVSLVRHLCAEAPLLLVLDDLHWADGSSLRLLGALAPELRSLPVLVVATYRPAEVGTNATLTDTLAQLSRLAETDRLELTGLARDDVATYLERSGVRATPRLVSEVHDRSGGNPFFVAELTRLILSQQSGVAPIDGGAAARVPHAVHDVTRQRLARLPDTTTDLLSLAAVAGRSSHIALLADAAELDVEETFDRLEPAVVTGLMVLDPDQPGCFQFSHDLQREAIVEALTLTGRLRLHRRVALAMAARDDGTGMLAGQIAHHFAAAMALGTADEALHWARVAASHATARGANDEAVLAWELALDAHRASTPADLAGRYELHLHLATARRSVWDLVGARAAIDDAIELAERLRDPAKVLEAAAITSDVALWNWNPPGHVPAELLRAMERALRALPPADSVTRARGLATLGVAGRYESPDRAREVTDEAIDIAERVGDTTELARMLNNAYLARWWWPWRHEQLALAERMLTLEALRPETEAIARMHRTVVLMGEGRIDDVESEMRRAAELREVVRWPDTAAQLDLTLACWNTLHGRQDRARELLERGYRARYQDSTMWAGPWVYYLGRSGIGDLTADEVDVSATTLAQLAAEEETDLARPTAIVALLRAERTREARELAGSGPRLQPCWSWAFSVVQWAAISCELDLPVAGEVYELLTPLAGGLAVAGSNLACFGPVEHWLGRLAEHLGHDEEANRHRAAASALVDRLGLRFVTPF